MEDRWELSAEQTPAFGPIAERFRRAGELERAVDLCREGLSRFPNHLSGRVTLGWALLDLGRYDEARAELERVIKRAPDNLAAIRGLAELHDRAEHAMFVPPEPQLAWPPKPPAAENPNAWRDPDQTITVASTLAPAAPAIEPEITADDLPALLAELEPVLPPSDEPQAATATAAPMVSVDAMGADTGRGTSNVDTTDGLVALQAAMAELDEALPGASADAGTSLPVVADFAAADTDSLDAVLSDLTREDARTESATSPAVQAPAIGDGLAIDGTDDTAEAATLDEPVSSGIDLSVPVVAIDAGEAPIDVAASAEDAIDLASAMFSGSGPDALPEAAVELLDDAAVDVAAETLAQFEAEAITLSEAPAIELAADVDVAQLFEASETMDLAAAGSDDPPLEPIEIKLGAAGAVNLASVDPTMDLETAQSDVDVDVPLDPALFELADAAAVEHSAPAVERIDEVFDLDPAPQFDITALEGSSEYYEPEPALRSPAIGSDAADRARAHHDLSLDAPGLAAAADLPQFEFHAPEHAATPAIVRDADRERAFDLAEALASAIRGHSDFVSPQIEQPEQADAEAPVVAAVAPPVGDTQWSEPEQPAPDVEAATAAVDADMTSPLPEASAHPEPVVAPAEARTRPSRKAKPAVAPPPVPPPPVATPPAAARVTRPIPGLEAFLVRIERRKAALARESAA